MPSALPTRRRALGALAGSAIALASGRVLAERRSIVAAASSLRPVLPGLIQDAGLADDGVRPVYGSSGNLYRQIAQGAPFGLFLAADADYAERLVREGRATGPSASWATARLALVVRREGRIAPDDRAHALVAAIADGTRPTVALANPAHAPYGQLAVAVLENLGVADALRGQLRIGENAAQAAQFAVAGGVDFALLPLALARLPALAARSRHVALDPSLHPELDHRMVLMKGATAAERALFDYLPGAPAQRRLTRAGFGEAVPG